MPHRALPGTAIVQPRSVVGVVDITRCEVNDKRPGRLNLAGAVGSCKASFAPAPPLNLGKVDPLI